MITLTSLPFTPVFSLYDESENGLSQNGNGNGINNGNGNGNGGDNGDVGPPPELTAEDLRTMEFNTPDEKLSIMTMMAEYNEFELWVLPITGAVAVRNTRTGQILFSNPYDVSREGLTNSVQNSLFSQLMVDFTVVRTGNSQQMNTFMHSAQRNQVSVTNIRNGVRVNYIIGQQDQRRIIPRWIEATHFRDLIYDINDPNIVAALMDFYGPGRRAPWGYTWRDEVIPAEPEAVLVGWRDSYPPLFEAPRSGNMAMYVLPETVRGRPLTTAMLNRIEGYWRSGVPSLDHETIANIHYVTGYVARDIVVPIFRMSLEFRLDADGLTVQLPANSINFNEEHFFLDRIEILPFFGAGSNEFSGYTFFPDGSGTIMNFSETRDRAQTFFRGSIYGIDHIFLELPGVSAAIGGMPLRNHNPRHQDIRMPVFGIVEDFQQRVLPGTTTPYRPPSAPMIPDPNAEADEDGNVPYIPDPSWEFPEDYVAVYEVVFNTRGFFAIIEEGAGLSELVAMHGGSFFKYNAIFLTVTPRPADRFDVGGALGVGDPHPWTIASRRKFTGSYTIRFIMLSDHEDSTYEPSYNGMALAYRNFLHETGVLSRMTNVADSIPLFIEALGAFESQDTFLSFPRMVMTPLTTFDDLVSMTELLNAAGITNIDYRLYGWANGGLTSQVPFRFDIERVLGGNAGLTEFLEFALQHDIGVFPDLDFVTANTVAHWGFGNANTFGGGFNANRHAARAINGLFNQHIEYDPVFQSLRPMFGSQGFGWRLVISPAFYRHFFDNVSSRLERFEGLNISSSTLGMILNSDFNDERAFNRMDTQRVVEQLLEMMQNNHDRVMVDGGNSYVFPFVDHILSMPLESSHMRFTAGSVPFMSMVLSGSMNFAGRPLNRASSIEIEILRIIENGAMPHFSLAYQNTHMLMNYAPNFFSVDFNIWLERLVEIYELLNYNLSDLQGSFFTRHEFIIGERIPTNRELSLFFDRANINVQIAREAYEAAILRYSNATALLARLREEGRTDLFAYVTNEGNARLAVIQARNDYHTVAATYAATWRRVYDATGNAVLDENGYYTFERDLSDLFDDEGNYISSRYTVNDSTLVMTTWENGVRFILNYNTFEVTTIIDGALVSVPPMSFIRLNS